MHRSNSGNDETGWRAAAVDDNPKTGRPSKYKPEFAEQAAKLCKLGATTAQLADFFGVAVSTCSLWMVEHADFSDAIKPEKAKADECVEQSLYRRAMGYEHDEDDIRVIDGQIVVTRTRKCYPPDTAAAAFWLKNRAGWRDIVDARHSGSIAGLAATMSDDELAAIARGGK